MTDKTILHDVSEETLEFFKQHSRKATATLIKEIESDFQDVAKKYSLDHLLVYLMGMSTEELVRSVYYDLEGHEKAKTTMQAIAKCTRLGVYHLVNEMLDEEAQCRAESITDTVHHDN